MNKAFVLAGGLLLVATTACAQQAAPAGAGPLRSTPVLAQPLSAPNFEGVSTTTSHLELAPGAVLTNPHTHPGDLFGYILEGSVLTGLEHGELVEYAAGEMFYEPQGILHTHFQNGSTNEPARVLIVLITKAEAQD